MDKVKNIVLMTLTRFLKFFEDLPVEIEALKGIDFGKVEEKFNSTKTHFGMGGVSDRIINVLSFQCVSSLVCSVIVSLLALTITLRFSVLAAIGSLFSIILSVALSLAIYSVIVYFIDKYKLRWSKIAFIIILVLIMLSCIGSAWGTINSLISLIKYFSISRIITLLSNVLGLLCNGIVFNLMLQANPIGDSIAKDNNDNQDYAEHDYSRQDFDSSESSQKSIKLNGESVSTDNFGMDDSFY